VAPMLAEYPFYQVYEMAAGTYEGQDEPVMVINDPATIFTSQFASDEQVYAITKALFDNLEELAQVHPEAAKITVETAVNTPIGLHQGAQLYFDEQAQ
ncbi:MAG: C4-dicarboxylate ABC transporter substrate-binding protein, partial [Rhizobiales bacterium]|nr:C4-dicarboxylate ABC transporter substrate-binding protein [Hyphomicrobiales bacterium]